MRLFKNGNSRKDINYDFIIIFCFNLDYKGFFINTVLKPLNN